jgi:malate synthase
MDHPPGVVVLGPPTAGADRVLTAEALAFVAELQRRFGRERARLLDARRDRQAALDAGTRPDLLPETADLRAADWTVAGPPADLEDRRVEITGPAERKMMINALNSGARGFMADLEDALSPTWANVVEGQANIADAVRRTLSYSAPDGRAYRLAERLATLHVRPRGWHLDECHVLVDGAPVAASLFDAGLFLFHNAAELIRGASGPYLYLPKLESHREARLWRDVLASAEDRLNLPRGSVRLTVLIENVLAAFEMDEILWELRDHVAGLNAGRWDYLFSIIRTFRARPDLDLPDRSQLTMTAPFMRAYTERLVRTCHRRGTHAIGGMSAFIPSRRDPEVNARALENVTADKERESADGFDGTWVAHPDLVPLAMRTFDVALRGRPHQKERRTDEPHDPVNGLLELRVPDGERTEAGLRQNVSVALAYLDSWLRGQGAAAIDNLMEDAATAEISRSLLWQWQARGARLADGRRVNAGLYRTIRAEEVTRLGGARSGRLGDAADILDSVVLDATFADFLTVRASARLD